MARIEFVRPEVAGDVAYSAQVNRWDHLLHSKGVEGVLGVLQKEVLEKAQAINDAKGSDDLVVEVQEYGAGDLLPNRQMFVGTVVRVKTDTPRSGDGRLGTAMTIYLCEGVMDPQGRVAVEAHYYRDLSRRDVDAQDSRSVYVAPAELLAYLDYLLESHVALGYFPREEGASW